MDRNTIIGLVLIAAVVLTWAIFFSDSGNETKPDPAAPQTEQTDSARAAAAARIAASAPKSDSLMPGGVSDSVWATMGDSARQAALNAEKQREHGVFTSLYEGTDKPIIVETDLYRATLHTKGARLGELLLKNYMTSDSHPLPIQTDSAGNALAVNFMQKANVVYPAVSSTDLHFQPSATGDIKVSGGDSAVLSFKAMVDDKHYLEYVYTFRGDDYDYGLEIKQTGMQELIEKQAMGVTWMAAIPKTERTMTLMREKTMVYYRESGSVENLGQNEVGLDNMTVAENRVDWVAFHSQFFTHTLMTADEKNSIENVKMAQTTGISPDPADPMAGDVVRYMALTYDLPIATQPSGSVKYHVYAGPLDYSILGEYGRGMNEQVALGWGPLVYINKWLTIPVFNFLEGFIGSYGLIILILGLVIKTIIYPLTYRTYLSTARMRLVNNTPEAKALETKYKDDPTKLQQEKMAVYRQYGVSMFGGCWPMLVQYPFLIALFFFFPNSIDLRQKSFLWAPDLSTYDSILDLPFTIPFYGNHVSLFTLLMTLSIFAYTIVNQRLQPQQNTNPVMKWFPYIMPIILLGFLNKYSAGLSWYYLLSNLISISQTYITRYFVSDEKLFAKMVEDSKTRAADPNKKKGTLERWAERQQERQKEVMQQRAESRGEAPAQRGSKTTPPKKRR